MERKRIQDLIEYFNDALPSFQFPIEEIEPFIKKFYSGLSTQARFNRERKDYLDSLLGHIDAAIALMKKSEEDPQYAPGYLNLKRAKEEVHKEAKNQEYNIERQKKPIVEGHTLPKGKKVHLSQDRHLVELLYQIKSHFKGKNGIRLLVSYLWIELKNKKDLSQFQSEDLLKNELDVFYKNNLQDKFQDFEKRFGKL